MALFKCGKKIRLLKFWNRRSNLLSDTKIKFFQVFSKENFNSKVKNKSLLAIAWIWNEKKICHDIDFYKTNWFVSNLITF
jgi:hypothetical protein